VRFWGRLEQRSTIDVFVTVATEGNRDLSGARIDRADEKSLVELARAIAERVGKIRSGNDASYKKVGARSAASRGGSRGPRPGSPTCW
jgi:pyruvate/2-oxoglutarate dehydrogenase complex dihydrolipoamide acyltransferase (E2) component